MDFYIPTVNLNLGSLYPLKTTTKRNIILKSLYRVKSSNSLCTILFFELQENNY